MSFFLQKNAISYRKMHFPAEKCMFLQKHALSCRKMQFSGGGGHMAGNRRKLQEGFRAQESRALANFHKRVCTLLRFPLMKEVVIAIEGNPCNIEGTSLCAEPPTSSEKRGKRPPKARKIAKGEEQGNQPKNMESQEKTPRVDSAFAHCPGFLVLGLRPFHPPRGVLGPFGPKVGNGVENEFPGPSGPRAPES